MTGPFLRYIDHGQIQHLQQAVIGREYSEETLKRYQKKFHVLDKIARNMNICEPSEELFNAYLSDRHNKYTGEYSVLKERQRIDWNKDVIY